MKIVNQLKLNGIFFLGLENSELKKLYIKTGRIIELMSKAILLVFMYIIPPMFVLPNSILSFYAFFTTDLGNDAFEMPFPMW